MITSALLVAAGVLLQSPPAPLSRPDLGQAYYLFLQGRVLEGRGDSAGAIASYRQALELTPRAAEIRAELAGLYAREGRAVEAVTEAEAALVVDPANREAHRILGFVQAALADRLGRNPGALIAQAIGHFERTLGGDLSDPGVELTLGRMYVRARRFSDAVTTLRHFLLDQPGYPDAMSLLVEAYEGTAQPRNSLIQSDLGDLYFQMKRYLDAAAAFDRALAGDQRGIDVETVTKKRDRARELAGR